MSFGAAGTSSVPRPAPAQPNFAYTVGPGTIVSLRLLDLPFGKRRYVVTYQTDAGEIFEIWQPNEAVPLLKGMYGFLTYTTNPERVIEFRVTERRAPPSMHAPQ
ncbi:MAG: hypothetical protein JO187_04315 [Acidobacteria bacterium]|nr:hypothetical protein [Acidobacteriota bacterium]